MKTIKTKTIRTVTGALIVAFALLGRNAQAQASDTWTGTTSANWGDSNWTGGNNPPSSGDSLIFTSATGAGGTALNNNLTSSSFNVANIIFNSGSAAFTVSGNAFNLTGNITNNSTSLETINDPFSMTTARFFTTTAGGGDLALGGILSGTGGGITKAGSGTLTLSAANSYSGATTDNGGILKLNNGSALPPSTTLTINSGAILDLNGQSNNILNFGAGNAAGMISNSAASVGTLTLTNWTTSLSTLVADGAAGPVAVNDYAQYQAAGGSLVNNNNTFSGGLTISGGASPAYSRFSFPGAAVPNGVPGNITNSYFGRGTITIGRSAAERAQIYLGGGAGETLLNNVVVNTALGADRVGTFRVDATTLLLKGTVTANLAPLTFSCNSGSACSAIVAGQITGPNGLVLKVNGSDVGAYVTCTLSNVTANPNNYQGGTEIDASGASAVFILAMGATNQIPNGPSAGDVTNNGALKLNGYSQTINGLWGAGSVDGVSGTPTLTIGANSGNSTNSCAIKNTAGSLNLTKTGTGTASLNGVLAYNGNTTVSGGTLSLSQANFNPSSIITIATNAILDLPGGGIYAVGQLITSSGQLQVTGGSQSDGWTGATSASWSQSNWAGGNNPPVTGDAIFFTSATGVGGTTLNNDLTSSSFGISSISFSTGAAGFTVNGNPFNLSGNISNNAASPQAINDSINLASVETITTTNPAGSLTLGGSLSGLGGIIATGPGALTLSGANNYSGVTTVGGGTLMLGNPSALPTTTTLLLANGSILDLSSNGGTIASFDGSSGFSSLITNSASGTNVSTLTVSSWSVGLNSFVVDGATAPVALAFQSVGTPQGGSLNNNSNTFSGGLTIGNSASGSGYARLGLNTPPVSTGVPGNITNSPFGRGTITIGNSASDKAQLFLNYANGPTNYTVLNNIVFNTALGSDRVGAVRNEGPWTFGGTLTANLAAVNFSCNNSITSSTNSALLEGQITGPNGLWLQHNASSPASTLTVTLSNVTTAANNYQGDTEIDTPHILVLGAANQIPHGASAGNLILDGTFNLNGYSQTINGLAGNVGPTGVVDGKSGTPTLTVGDNDAYSEFDGVITNSAGSLSLTKIGAGTLTLTATNGYSGNTTVNGGTLDLAQPTLAASSTVTVTNGASLQLDFSTTNTVAGLVLNGVSQALGVYDSTTGAPYITGAGSLLVQTYVAPLGTNAYLASLAVNPPAGTLPGFATNVFGYSVTVAYANNPVQVTASSVDPNATMTLAFNNVPAGSLTNGVASTSQTLHLPTNTVAVTVVSQDLSQTNTYTVNVRLQPSQTVPNLTNRVNGTSLTLAWPADHLGYRLLVQTNNLNQGVSSNTNDWGTVAGSTAVTSTNITIIQDGVTNEYYRLVYP
jgi:autotransporter-associated beta strand protein